jgi:hypothetical protein
MGHLSQRLTTFVFALALLTPAVITGCAARVYDTGHGDYHAFNGNENNYYARWESETHRNHVDIKKRPAAEQKEYFDWRHNQH